MANQFETGDFPMKIRAFAAAIAAASMAILPAAAHAGTSAASMAPPVAYGAHSTASVAKKNNGKGEKGILIALAAGAAGLGLYFALRNNDDRTPGAQS